MVVWELLITYAYVRSIYAWCTGVNSWKIPSDFSSILCKDFIWSCYLEFVGKIIFTFVDKSFKNTLHANHNEFAFRLEIFNKWFI